MNLFQTVLIVALIAFQTVLIVALNLLNRGVNCDWMKLTMGWNAFVLMKSQATLIAVLMPFQTGVMIESLNHLNAAPRVSFR